MAYQSRHTGPQIDAAVDVYLSYNTPAANPWLPKTCDVVGGNWVENDNVGNSSAAYKCVLYASVEKDTTRTTINETPFVWFRDSNTGSNLYYVDFRIENGNVIAYSNIQIAGTFYILGIASDISYSTTDPSITQSSNQEEEI